MDRANAWWTGVPGHRVCSPRGPALILSWGRCQQWLRSCLECVIGPQRPLRWLIVFLVAAVFAPSVANAASVRLEFVPTMSPEMCPSACIAEGYALTVRDRRGERNDLLISEDDDVIVKERRAKLRLTGDSDRSRCGEVSARTISCGADHGVFVRAGAGNDRVRFGEVFSGGSVEGGPGDDVLRGAVTQSGGRGDDRLTGGDDFGELAGGPGDDVIRVVSSLVSGVDGGSGRDVIYARNGNKDTVQCGSGRDRVATADRDDVLRGCERRPSAAGAAERPAACPFQRSGCEDPHRAPRGRCGGTHRGSQHRSSFLASRLVAWPSVPSCRMPAPGGVEAVA